MRSSQLLIISLLSFFSCVFYYLNGYFTIKYCLFISMKQATISISSSAPYESTMKQKICDLFFLYYFIKSTACHRIRLIFKSLTKYSSLVFCDHLLLTCTQTHKVPVLAPALTLSIRRRLFLHRIHIETESFFSSENHTHKFLNHFMSFCFDFEVQKVQYTSNELMENQDKYLDR